MRKSMSAPLRYPLKIILHSDFVDKHLPLSVLCASVVKPLSAL
jgi:hypothetical protein